MYACGVWCGHVSRCAPAARVVCAVRARTRDRLGVVTRRRAPPVRATAGAAEGSGPCGAARATGPALVWRGRHALSPVCINRRPSVRTPQRQRVRVCRRVPGAPRCYGPSAGPARAPPRAASSPPAPRGRTPPGLSRVRSDYGPHYGGPRGGVEGASLVHSGALGTARRNNVKLL